MWRVFLFISLWGTSFSYAFQNPTYPLLLSKPFKFKSSVFDTLCLLHRQSAIRSSDVRSRGTFSQRMYPNLEVSAGMQDIVDKYDAFLLDQWGVLHDGTKAYDGAVPCLNELLRRGKLIVLLSNSSKRLGNSMKKLDAMGIDRFVETSIGIVCCLSVSPNAR